MMNPGLHNGFVIHVILQIATKVIDEAVFTARLAEQEQASFIDLNCGCPIYDVSGFLWPVQRDPNAPTVYMDAVCLQTTRRGLGAILLRKPHKLARLVAGIVEQVAIPCDGIRVSVWGYHTCISMGLP